MEALRREGVTAFVDRAGRRWSLHTYGSMVLRTTSRQAEIMAVLTADPDHDLYQISAHGTTCRLCAGLEGRVYSRSGTDPDFPPLTAAFGRMDPAGPDTLANSWLNIHPNCLHQLRRWTPMGRSAEEVQKIKDFSSFRKNPPSRDPRSEAQIAAYRQKERNRARYLRDYRQWERYRETLGEAAPKTLETFRRHKYAVTDPETGKRRGDGKFKGWAAAYRRENGLAHSTKSGIIDPKRPGEIPEVSKSSKFRRTLTPEDVTREYLDHAVPGQGSVTLEDGYRAKGHQDEIDMAEWLHRTFGGDIRLLKESDIKNQKRPDFLWNGKAWELKGTSSTIDRAGEYGSMLSLKPDLFAITMSGQYEDRWFIEVDLATESPSKVVDKCERYHKYYRSGLEQQEAGVFPLTVWIVPTVERKEKLIKHIREAFDKQPRLFTVITKDELWALVCQGGEGGTLC